MRVFSFLVAVLLGGVSLAMAGEPNPNHAATLISLAEETHAMCRLGEGIGAATEATIKAACDTRDIYWDALAELGYCFDTGERTWEPCKSGGN